MNPLVKFSNKIKQS
jgi:hypothetical protein